MTKKVHEMEQNPDEQSWTKAENIMHIESCFKINSFKIKTMKQMFDCVGFHDGSLKTMTFNAKRRPEQKQFDHFYTSKSVNPKWEKKL